MADIVACITEPAKTVGKWIGEQLYHQLAFIWFFTANITGLKEQFQKLNDDTAELEGEVQTARDNRSQKPVPRVTTWLTNSNNLKVEINDILNEAENVGSGVCSNVGARFSLSKRAKETTELTEKLRAEKPSAQFQPGPTAATQEVELGKTFECESRKKIEEEIIKTLKDGDESMIGIHGMGGLGKTTMAKKLMNRALKEKIFEEVVIATVSQNVVIAKIQDEIGGQLGLDMLKEEKSEFARAKMLHSRLSDTKRTTLLVLDDVWDTLTLEDFGIPRHSIGCRILFTSRNRDVLHAMDDVQIFGMKVLSEDEAWSFFKEKVGSCAEDKELKDIPKQVAKECGGMPINLAAVGAVLKDKPMQRLWNHTLDQLKQCVPNNVRYDKQNYNPLRLSYEYLKSEDHSKPAESIFLLCCLFPEDADIPVDYLTYFCMGLHIFEDNITNMEKARDLMWTKTELLKDRSLLLESDKKDCVRMHDVVRDVCTLIAKEEGYISKDGGRWISSTHLVGQRNELLSGSRCPNLNLLFLDSRYDNSLGFEFDDAIMKGITELNVLCIKRYSFTISVVGNMVNLAILICRDCYSIKELPTEIKGLNRLKVLDLTRCYKLQSIGRGIIASLVGLEELKMRGSFKRWEAEEREERENASIKELEALPNLTCLEIEIDDPSVLAENMPQLSNKIVRFVIKNNFPSYFLSKFSKAVSLSLERASRLGDWIETQFLRDTEYLYLGGQGANNVDLGRCENIRWLKLCGCESVKNVVTTSGGSDDATVFPLIEYLEVDSLPELQEIWDGPISSTSFQNLKELKLNGLKALTQIWKSSSVCQNNNVPHFSNLSSIEIWHCPRLRNLGQLSMAGKHCLPQLQQLIIGGCQMMEQVFLWNDDKEEAGENKTSSILITKVFPKLKLLELSYLRNLTTFNQGIRGIEFPLLQTLTIKGCPKWKSIIDGSNSADFDEDGSSHLLCQPQKILFGSSFKVLEMDHNPFCGHEIPSSLFNRLEELTIFQYVSSMSLFTLPMAANLGSLRVLRISKCDEMTNVIEDEQQQERILVFLKLEKLYLEQLPKLVSFCVSKCGVQFPSLRKVVICRCPSMEIFSLGLVAATPNVEALTTDLSTYVGVHHTSFHSAFTSLKRLKIKENENPFDHHKISISLFRGLEQLLLHGYKGSVSLFSPSAVGNLVNLKVLLIAICDETVKVIEDEDEKEDGKVEKSGEIRSSVVFPKLEKLSLGYLPKLESFCEWKRDVKLPSLRLVQIIECPNMEKFSMGLIATPNLEIVEIDEEEIDITKDLNVGVQQHYLARQEKRR